MDDKDKLIEILIGSTSVWSSSSPSMVYALDLDVSSFTGTQYLILKVSVPSGSVAKQAVAWFDNIRFTVYAPDSTVIWNAVTASATVNKAVIEAIKTLGTGTITYYISRNGGTTFTQCTEDAVTDISAQPSGTNIVVKAVITGNAELSAIAWGGITI